MRAIVLVTLAVLVALVCASKIDFESLGPKSKALYQIESGSIVPVTQLSQQSQEVLDTYNAYLVLSTKLSHDLSKITVEDEEADDQVLDDEQGKKPQNRQDKEEENNEDDKDDEDDNKDDDNKDDEDDKDENKDDDHEDDNHEGDDHEGESPVGDNEPTVPGIDLEQMNAFVNLAKEAWSFIAENKAVSNVASFFGNALPSGVKTSMELYGWQEPVQSNGAAEWRNSYGMLVGRIDYTLSFIPGGKVEDSKGNIGLYLDRITILPTQVYVMWGYTADCTASISSITNVGTKEAPIAAATIDLTFKFSALSSDSIVKSYYVRGDGKWKSLN